MILWSHPPQSVSVLNTYCGPDLGHTFFTFYITQNEYIHLARGLANWSCCDLPRRYFWTRALQIFMTRDKPYILHVKKVRLLKSQFERFKLARSYLDISVVITDPYRLE